MNEQRKLGDRYQVGEVLGRGGMATVRRAHDVRLHRDVAVKELRTDLASDGTFQERFRREAHASGGLNHPNIVAVYDTGEDADPATGVEVPYIVMELVQGRTLRDVLRDGRPLVPERALEFSVGVLDALAYSHKAGIIHRDIKPANVMITNTGIVKVMDFGIARAVSDTSSTMTQTAAVIGTAQYLSPEQARGETVDARSDIYSAGCLLYELLTGRPPFTGDSPVSVAYQHVREQPVPPSQLDAEITPEMDTVVLKALAKDPRDRYQTAGEMSADIRRMLAGQPVQGVLAAAIVPVTPVAEPSDSTTVLPTYQAGPARAIEPAPKPRRRWLWPVILGTLLVATVAGALSLNLLQQTAQVTVPSVINKEQGIAETTLKDKNLQPRVTEVQGPNDSTVGRVTSQNPAANTEVPPQTVVEIAVNVGPKKLTIPTGLLKKNVNDVVAQLTALGFSAPDTQPAATEAPDDQANQVLSIDPVEGAQIPAGQKITIYFATGKAKVPNLALQDKAAATVLLNEAGFRNLSWEPQASTMTPGLVTGTDPAAFTKVNKADKLTIYYAVAASTPTVTVTAPPPPSKSPSASATPTPGG